MVKCGLDGGLQFRVIVGLGFTFRDQLRVRVDVRVSVGIRVSAFYFCHTSVGFVCSSLQPLICNYNFIILCALIYDFGAI